MTKVLPPKVEKRLQDLLDMEEFKMDEVEACRNEYWNDRDGWHQVLIWCFDSAKKRLGTA